MVSTQNAGLDERVVISFGPMARGLEVHKQNILNYSLGRTGPCQQIVLIIGNK